MQLQPTDYYR